MIIGRIRALIPKMCSVKDGWNQFILHEIDLNIGTNYVPRIINRYLVSRSL